MIQNPLLLDIPSFVPEYQEEIEYGYKNKPRENLEKILRKTSKNHCMYCYCLFCRRCSRSRRKVSKE